VITAGGISSSNWFPSLSESRSLSSLTRSRPRKYFFQADPTHFAVYHPRCCQSLQNLFNMRGGRGRNITRDLDIVLFLQVAQNSLNIKLRNPFSFSELSV